MITNQAGLMTMGCKYFETGSVGEHFKQVFSFLSGVTVGAGAVVTNDVLPYAIEKTFLRSVRQSLVIYDPYNHGASL